MYSGFITTDVDFVRATYGVVRGLLGMRMLVLVAIAACTPVTPAPIVEEPSPIEPTVAAPPAIAGPRTGCSWDFAGTFTIGGAPFRLSIDTGSGVVAVAGSGCATCTASGVEHVYTPGATATDQHHETTAAYDGGDMRWTGEEYVDVVGVGSAAAQVSLYSITSHQQFFARGGCASSDGILGLSGDGKASWLAALVEAGVPDEFALHKCTNDGMLWLGGYDASATTAPPAWVPMAAHSGYRVSIHDVAIGGASVGVPASSYGFAVVDSGGPAMFLPEPAFDAIMRALGDNPTFREQLGDPATWFEHGRCRSIALSRDQLDAALPGLSITLDGATLEMRPSESYLSVVRWRDQTLFCPALPRPASRAGSISATA